MSRLEHLNISVTNPQKTAALLQQLFDWKIRWQGPSLLGGYTVHVGGEHDYLALYAEEGSNTKLNKKDRIAGGFNHVGVIVDDLDLVDQRVAEAGLAPHSHQDYEPGRRFYFTDEDGVEYEVVSY